MKKRLTLKAAMTPFPYSVKMESSLVEAHQMMVKHHIHHLPVMSNAKIYGIITQRDIDAIQNLVLDIGSNEALEVRHAYIAKPYIVDINEPLENVLLTMADKHIGAAVITKHQKLAGVFTFIDAFRYFGEYIKAQFPEHNDNDAA